ncbi:hypothetical protein FACS1894190_13990 [Spirochaetia bacterium]|nr:hypothetical protein FACS1894190_13990 [Spirochaetia bacterium]
MELKLFGSKFFCLLGMLIFFGCASGEKSVTAVADVSNGKALDTAGEKSVAAVTNVSNGKALDTAIEEAAVRIDNAFKAGTEIALVSVSSPSAPFSEYVLSYLETVLVNNGKLAVVDRANLDKIRA